MIATRVESLSDEPVEVELISAREDARRLCLGALEGEPRSARSLVVRVGETFTTVVYAVGGQPTVVWNISHSAAVVAANEAVEAHASEEDATFRIREVTHQTVGRARLGLLRGSNCRVVAASRIARAVITLAAEGGNVATAEQIRAATETLSETWAEDQIGGLPGGGVGALLVGAAVLEALVDAVGCREITSRRARAASGS